jgi:hypothetical protein
MKLQRLVEMIREVSGGAEEWPVLFTCFTQNSTGEWKADEAREPIVSVEVEEGAEEVLLIRDSDCQPLSVASLEQQLTELMSRYGEFMVDCCETPIVVDGCETPIVVDDNTVHTVHIDFPIGGVGRDEKNRCFVVAYVSRMEE